MTKAGGYRANEGHSHGIETVIRNKCKLQYVTIHIVLTILNSYDNVSHYFPVSMHTVVCDTLIELSR